jgi:glycine betaine/proline transport system permease protein
MTAVATAPRAARRPRPAVVEMVLEHARLWALLLVVVGWVAVWAVTQGEDTLAISASAITDTHRQLQDASTWVEDAVSSGSNVAVNAVNSFADAINAVFEWLQQIFTVAKFPRPLPQIGWLGTIALAALVTFAAAGWRSLLLVTGIAVGIAAAVGIPLGLWMGHSPVVTAIVTPVLDVMQTMPSFVYLLPISILFGIGPAAAIIVTLIYATPPVVRITAHGIRTLPAGVMEATASMGQSRRQRLTKVELPLAKRTIIVGINQTMMAALSMATIAAFIDGPGLGQPVLDGLKRGQLGTSFVAGIAIVVMAIMLDRTTTAASVRAEQAKRADTTHTRLRRATLGVGAVATLVALFLSHNYVWANEFPSRPDLGTPIRDRVDAFGQWLLTDVSGLTTSIQTGFTERFLNPVQSLIAESPWFVTAAAITLIAVIVGGVRALVFTVVCLAGIYYLDLWNFAMVTLTSVLVATAVVVALAVVVGVWMGRNRTVDRVIRPFLDAGQTMPPFVFLIPIFILFGPNRFTAMVAGVIYAAPIAIKLVTDGIRGVSTGTVEAAESSGTSRWQMITKVQLPMSRGSLLLATNQGLLYVLSMVVIGGMAGAGALGFDIVHGFRNSIYVASGLAAGISVVLLGIMLDRITTYGARRTERSAGSGGRLMDSVRRLRLSGTPSPNHGRA